MSKPTVDIGCGPALVAAALLALYLPLIPGGCKCGHFSSPSPLLFLLTALAAAAGGARPRSWPLFAPVALVGCAICTKAVIDVAWRGHSPLFAAPPPFLLVPIDVAVFGALAAACGGVGGIVHAYRSWRASRTEAPAAPERP